LNSETVPADLSQYERPAEWGTLPEWEALGASFSRGDDGPWWVVSLFYSDPGAADADADELLQRMRGYDTALTELMERGAWVQQPIDRSCSQLTADVQRYAASSTLTIRCALTEDPVAWWLLVDLRDLGFLLP
jgi:hypothetical protein